MRIGLILVLVSVFLSAMLVQAAPSARQICQKMISDGRAGGVSQRQCECNHRVAMDMLDKDIRALLFDAWYNGNNNIAAVERLPDQKRVMKQMENMALAVSIDCK